MGKKGDCPIKAIKLCLLTSVLLAVYGYGLSFPNLSISHDNWPAGPAFAGLSFGSADFSAHSDRQSLCWGPGFAVESGQWSAGNGEYRTEFSFHNAAYETTERTTIKIPLLGEIDAKDYSLPALAVVLGLVDGFNPCAMWALVYLISLVVSLQDRRKIWILVGSFVLASGILYFLFMAAWLNAFLFIGFFRPITIIIGLIAIFAGIHNIVEIIKTKGALACKIEDEQSKRKTMDRMKDVVFSPITFTNIIAIIFLAFIVNSIEFVCSSAIPAIFTHILSISKLSWLEYYGYIVLYDFFFMLDDLIIFGSAAFAVDMVVGDKYLKYCRIIGGVLLFVLGFLLLFMPHLLQ